VVGALPEHLIYAFEQGFGYQFRHIPFDAALSELMTIVDVFANPFRPGGGNSANNALSAGTVLLTLDQGDVASLVPPEHRAVDQFDYFERLIRLVEDPSQMAAWRELQQSQHAGLVDQTAFLESLRSMTGLAYERFLARRSTPLTSVIDGS
jgi:hypothetical protein